MSKTRNNHYVPQWYQKGFFESGKTTLTLLDMKAPETVLADGRRIISRSVFDSPTSRAFCERDLYSTFFGSSVNDEIERYLFGEIDAKGSNAIKAFAANDASKWHEHFQTLFQYIDIQKIRTPKGLDWLKAQYPNLSQNELMFEMQGIQMLHCTIWAGGVREIVSAEDADLKFIVSDTPVTIYNHACSPEAKAYVYPRDPSIALKGSQTIFPLNKNFCLILTNLEYARDPSSNVMEKRTFARNYKHSMARTDAFIRTRKLSNQDVAQINYVLKRRARRYIAAGRKEWLHPENSVSVRWSDLRQVLLPPKEELWHFGGEMFAQFDDGRVYYQDEFGRTEKQRAYLRKELKTPPRPKEACGCGSGSTFEACCMSKPSTLRPSWTERSIRERNLMLQNGLAKVLGLGGKDWTQVRREITDAQISEVYRLYEGLWPLETDLISLLPKPDGMVRAVYTGSIHPYAIKEFALGASLYFGSIIIEHPFLHAGTVKKEFSPTENPQVFRQEVLKSLLLFFNLMPLVEVGLVNLIPDPCSFDFHLRDQMMHMAKSRSGYVNYAPDQDLRLDRLMKEDMRRGILSFPRDTLRQQMQVVVPNLDEAKAQMTLDYAEQLKEHDPLAVLQKDSVRSGKQGGFINMMKLAPNFEIAMYLAQATGACIITDSVFRWRELQAAITSRAGGAHVHLSALARNIEKSTFTFPQNVMDVVSLAAGKRFDPYPKLMGDAFKYLLHLADREPKPNREANLAGRFARLHGGSQTLIKKAGIETKAAQIVCAFPHRGIQDNNANRLLLMSSSEKHLPNVPMAFFLQESRTLSTS